MQRLLREDCTPPDGFRFLNPETGFLNQAIDIYNWVIEICAHRKANNLPPITKEQAVDQLCKTLPPGWCVHDDSEQSSRSWVNTRLSFSDIVAGTKAYLALIASGFQTVSQEEADRRAKLCSGCYLKVTPQGCGACVKLASLITGSVAQKKTKYDSNLANFACAACSCPVQSIVHFPLPLLESADNDQKQASFSSFCWRKRDSENYKPDAD